MTDTWRKDIAQVALGTIRPAEFLKANPEMAHDPATAMREAIARAQAAHDGPLLEDALLLGAVTRGELRDSSVLARLLEEDWHTQHENLASMLQRARDPRSIPALARAARYLPAYLAWDENRALAVKCMHALEDIGTEDAKAALRGLSQDPDPVVSEAATRMLERARPPKAPPRSVPNADTRD